MRLCSKVATAPESFDDCRSEPIAAKLKILYKCRSCSFTARASSSFASVASRASTRLRPADNETRGDVTWPAYRGDIINRDVFTAEDREPDPVLMLRAYERAGLTLNFIRALTDAWRFADLHHPEYWDVSFAQGAAREQYEKIVTTIRESLDFVSAITGVESEVLRRVDVYTSHEAFYFLRGADPSWALRRAGWYNLSTHFPWIGMRTAQLDGAHVEFFRGIRNPIGNFMVGPR